MIKLVRTNIHGVPVGEDNPTARYSDATVARARDLRAEGWTLSAIAEELGVKTKTVVHDWVIFRRRKPPARIVARRVKPSEKVHATDSESSVNSIATSTYSDVRNSACS